MQTIWKSAGCRHNKIFLRTIYCHQKYCDKRFDKFDKFLNTDFRQKKLYLQLKLNISRIKEWKKQYQSKACHNYKMTYCLRKCCNIQFIYSFIAIKMIYNCTSINHFMMLHALWCFFLNTGLLNSTKGSPLYWQIWHTCILKRSGNFRWATHCR